MVKVDGNLLDWLNDGRLEYLPPFMRDFHDQKDLFKTIDEAITSKRCKKFMEEHGRYRVENLKRSGFVPDFPLSGTLDEKLETWVLGHDAGDGGIVPWNTAMIFTIDTFLWFMAAHGYTLQKTHKKGLVFCDIDKSLREAWEIRQEKSAAILKAALNKG